MPSLAGLQKRKGTCINFPRKQGTFSSRASIPLPPGQVTLDMWQLTMSPPSQSYFVLCSSDTKSPRPELAVSFSELSAKCKCQAPCSEIRNNFKVTTVEYQTKPRVQVQGIYSCLHCTPLEPGQFGPCLILSTLFRLAKSILCSEISYFNS